jgi:hypothetical protein
VRLDGINKLKTIQLPNRESNSQFSGLKYTVPSNYPTACRHLNSSHYQFQVFFLIQILNAVVLLKIPNYDGWYSSSRWYIVCLNMETIARNTVSQKKSFTTLKAYVNLFRGHVQCFELS